MRERSILRVLVLSTLITFGVGLLALLFELLRSISISRTSGIGFAAGGVSEKFIALMAIGLPIVFALVYSLLTPKKTSSARRPRRSR
jgi:hypothetical protein